ncbi:MAG: AraC family transcriptional regulator [Planctomycetes bacterium]|nr:AraC family transcriptional regulator [Planctomycetota bacterium]
MFSMKRGKKHLAQILTKRMPAPGNYPTPISGIMMHRRDEASLPENCLYLPRIIYIVQGSKRSVVGGTVYRYYEDNLLIAAVHLPNTSRIVDASPRRPCLSLTLDLDPVLITKLVMEIPAPSSGSEDSPAGIVLQPLQPEVLDAFIRLVTLLDEPADIPLLAPLVSEEIHYRILTRPGGDAIRQYYTYGSQKHQIARAIAWMRENFRERLTVEDMAAQVHMAASTFFRHFKVTTSVSPLQFQKRLRLHEAQRLMLTETMDAASASAAVGYESVTQFTREYKRLFGNPPRRDITRWQSERTRAPALLPGE